MSEDEYILPHTVPQTNSRKIKVLESEIKMLKEAKEKLEAQLASVGKNLSKLTSEVARMQGEPD